MAVQEVAGGRRGDGEGRGLLGGEDNGLFRDVDFLYRGARPTRSAWLGGAHKSSHGHTRIAHAPTSPFSPRSRTRALTSSVHGKAPLISPFSPPSSPSAPSASACPKMMLRSAWAELPSASSAVEASAALISAISASRAVSGAAAASWFTVER